MKKDSINCTLHSKIILLQTPRTFLRRILLTFHNILWALLAQSFQFILNIIYSSYLLTMNTHNGMCIIHTNTEPPAEFFFQRGAHCHDRVLREVSGTNRVFAQSGIYVSSICLPNFTFTFYS